MLTYHSFLYIENHTFGMAHLLGFKIAIYGKYLT